MTKPTPLVIRQRTIDVLVNVIGRLLHMTAPNTKYILILDGPLETITGEHAMSFVTDMQNDEAARILTMAISRQETDPIKGQTIQ